MSNTTRSVTRLLREAFWNAHHLLIAAGIACVSWLAFYTFGRDPDITEAGWVFFCVIGILFHRENLSETYRDRESVRRHPSSNAADLRNLGDHIRGEWLRIATKTLFLGSGMISLYFLPRANETTEMIRGLSVIFLMTGVALLDIDAVLDKLARRELVRMVIQEINARPLGLPVDQRLILAIKAGRDLFHDEMGAWGIVIPVLEMIQRGERLPEGMTVASVIDQIEAHISNQGAIHADIRSYDPSAGGPPKGKTTEDTPGGQ